MDKRIDELEAAMSEPTEQEIREALLDADGCQNTEEGDCGTGAVVLASAHRAQAKRFEELEAENSAILKRLEAAEKLIETHRPCHDKDICPEWKAYEAAKGEKK